MLAYPLMLLCAVFLGFLVYRYDLYEREPWFMLLLALSPVFHRDLAAMPYEIALLNSINPLSQVVMALYGALGITGPVEPPYAMLAVALVVFVTARMMIRRAYQEIAKIV